MTKPSLRSARLSTVIASGSEAIQLMMVMKAQCLYRATSFDSNWIASRSLAMTQRDV